MWYYNIPNMGRKENREKMVKIYMTEKEKQKVEQEADDKGQQLSSYGRLKLLGEA